MNWLRVMSVSVVLAAPAWGALKGPVKVEGGLVEGVAGEAAGITVFKGIPFAAPPVGELRWRAPQPAAAWAGVWKADRFGNDCVQRKSGAFGPWSAEYISKAGMEGGSSEDCLYLNVWTPAKTGRERLPVFVWIHGGGFNSGSGGVPVYDGEGLASKGLVMVTINYRVGALGFLAHPELTKESGRGASGNYALMDMVAALEWVKKNIGVFGGDAGNVTIAGQSAGAFAVNYLTASPLAKGLFHRAIGESGGAFMGGRTLKEAEAAGVKFAEAQKAATLKELRAIPAEKFAAGGMGMGAVIDGYVVPRNVREIFEAGEQNDVPTLVGWNLDDGVSFGQPPTGEAFKARAATQYGEMAAEFLKAFPAETNEQAAASERAVGRAQIFAWQGRTWARLQAKTGKGKVYVYEFDKVAPGNAEQRKFGAFHSGEIAYALNTLGKWERPWEAADRKLAEVMSTYWANFAKTGDPNGKGVPKWPAYTMSTEQAMRLGETVAPMPAPHKAQLDFFDAFAAKRR